jgi:hypothetical protein
LNCFDSLSVVRRCTIRCHDGCLTHLPGPPPPPLFPESATLCSAPTKIFHPDMAHCNESNTCHNRQVPSQPSPLSSTDPIDCRLIPRWPPRPPPPVVGNKSFALDGAGSPFNFQALFSFLRAVIGCSLACVAYALRSLSSRFNAGIWCNRFNIRRRFGGKPSSIKQFRSRRIPVFALFGLCIATAPWSVHSQVNNYMRNLSMCAICGCAMLPIRTYLI